MTAPARSRRLAAATRLLGYAREEALRLLVGLVGLACNAATNLSFPRLLGEAVDRAAACSEEQYLRFLLGCGGVFAVGAAASFTRVFCFNTATDRICSGLRRRLFESYLRRDMASLESARSAEMSVVMTEDALLAAEACTERVAATLRALNSSLLGSLALFRVSPELCAVTLSVVPFISVGAMLLSRLSRAAADALRVRESECLGYCLERVGALSTVQVNNAAEQERRRFDHIDADMTALRRSKHLAQAALMGYLTLATNAALLAVLAAGGRLVSRGRLTPGTLSRFAFQAAFVALGFGGLSSAYGEAVKGLDAAARVFDQMDAAPQRPSSHAAAAPAPAPATLSCNVQFRGVSFTYASRPGRPLLNCVDAEAPPLAITCVCGPSGCGKSTLLLLAAGLLSPGEGSVLVCGADVAAADSDWLRRRVAVVEQSSALFAGSVRYNLSYGLEGREAGEAELALALGQADALGFVQALPRGLDTEVGERGALLSGGQRTRLVIARALLRQPSVLLLDEPTAAVDAASERELMDTLLRLRERVTVVVCSHSAAVATAADRVYDVLDSGSLLERKKS